MDYAFYLVSISNAASGVGRYFGGLLSDRVGELYRPLCAMFMCSPRAGPINIMIPILVISAAITYAWPFAHSLATLTVLTIIYGFFSGSFIALLVNPVIEFGGDGDVGRRIGMMFTLLSLGMKHFPFASDHQSPTFSPGALAGPPISGAILTSSGGFNEVGYYAGWSTSFVFRPLSYLSRECRITRRRRDVP